MSSLVEYRRFCVIDTSTDTIFQTDHEQDAFDFAEQCPFGEVAFFEIPNEDSFDHFWTHIVQTKQYADFTGV